ncbi:MAG: ATP-binding protein [Sandaracinaceae bacterium]
MFAESLQAARDGRAARVRLPPNRVLFAWPVPKGLRVMISADPVQQAERAEAAELAAEVTHEVANSLTAIAGWAQLAAGAGPLPPRAAHALTVVQRAAGDALHAARELLSSMRQSVAPPVPAMEPAGDVRAALDRALEALRPTLEEAGVEVDAECAPGLWVGLPPATLRSVMDNLVRNAGEALAEAGVDAPRISVQANATANGGELVVSDNGPGVPSSIRDRVFDRYVSTKKTGTGLGLALIRDAVERAGGSIVLADTETGARFVVTMPAAAQTVPDRALPETPAEPHTIPPSGRPDGEPVTPQGRSVDPLGRSASVDHTASGVHRRPAIRSRSVLSVDDDLPTRTMVKTALELSGAIVTTADGYESARLLSGAFDIALVDVHLGDGRGDALLGELRKKGLGLAVILTGSHRALAPEAQPDAVLRKPFELEELERLLDGLLDPSEPLGEESQG